MCIGSKKTSSSKKARKNTQLGDSDLGIIKEEHKSKHRRISNSQNFDDKEMDSIQRELKDSKGKAIVKNGYLAAQHDTLNNDTDRPSI